MKKQLTILIADDNDLMREAVKTILSLWDNVKLVREARNGEEAIFLAGKIFPDVILMDINMSPVNGFEATQKILGVNSDIKIIGLSVNRQASYARNMMLLGARGYLIKTSPYKEIIFAIETVIAGDIYIDKAIEGTV